MSRSRELPGDPASSCAAGTEDGSARADFSTDLQSRILQLEANEKRHRLVVENVSDVIWVLDLATSRFLFVSPSVERLRGYTAEEVVAQDMAAVVTPQSLAYILEGVPSRLEACRAGEARTYVDQIEQTCKDGSTIWTETSTRYVVDAETGRVLVYGTSRDITERRRAEEELRRRVELQNQLAKIASAVPGVIYSFRQRPDGSSCIPYASSEFEAIPGLRPGEVVSDASPIFAMMHADDVERVRASIARSAQTLSPWHEEFRVHHPRKGECWIEGRSLPRREADGSILWHGFIHEITERKLVEQSLREAKQRAEDNQRLQAELLNRFDNSQRCAKIGNWDWDMVCDIVWWSDEMYRIFDLDPREYTPTVTGNAKYFHPEDAGPFLNEFDNVIRTGGVLNYDLRIITAAGAMKFCNARGAVEYAADGTPQRFFGTLLDETDRRRAEEALSDSEAQFRAMFEMASIGMAQADLHTGRWHRVNRKLCEITGYSAAEMLAMRISQITHPEDRQEDWEAFQRVVRGEAPDYRMEKRYLHKDGHTAWVNVNMTVVRDAEGRPTRTVAAIEDITERRLAEQARAQSLQQQRQLNELRQTLLAPGTLSQKLSMLSDGVVRIFGADFCRIWCIGPGDLCQRGCLHAAVGEGPLACRRRDQCLHLIASSGRYTHTDGARRRVPFGASWIGHLAAGPTHRILTNDAKRDAAVDDHAWAARLGLVASAGYQLRPPGGETLGVLLYFSRHAISPEEDAQVDALSSTAAHIIRAAQTDRSLHESEERLFRLNAGLEERVRDRTAALEAANQELEAFAYSVSHDLRAPLRAIDGFSQALLEDCAERLDEQGRGYLGRVCAGARRMDQLIDDLLQLSRVARAELHCDRVDLSALARAVAADLCRLHPQRVVELTVADGVQVEGDGPLLQLVLENLLGNAWKFTGNCPAARIEFGVSASSPPQPPVFFVRDNGAGFDMAYAGKLFGAFQRLHNVAEFPGTGIGLASVKRIIHRHGGQVWAEGAVGQGATFYFTLAEERDSSPCTR